MNRLTAALAQSREQYSAVWHLEQGFRPFSETASSSSDEGVGVGAGVEQCAHLFVAGGGAGGCQVMWS
jgi:hypothetical protein